MSRFVRPSKYRHVYGTGAKKEYCLDNIKLSNSAWDTNMISASGKYISVNWNASGGGAFAILPAPSPFSQHSLPAKLPDVIPLARGHTAPVLDTEWSTHDDSVVASGGDDGHILIWKVDDSLFEGWGNEKYEPKDLDPVLRIGASSRRVGQVGFHPTAKHVLASATGEHTVKLWDLGSPEDPKAILTGHTDAIQSFAFNFNGNLIATTCRDRKLRLFDPRSGGDAVRVSDGHGGIKGARVVWMGDQDRIATTGFSKMSDRQLAIWETASLGNVKMMSVDQSSGVLMPFYSDNGILFVAGKGDGNIRYYEWESDTLYALSEYQSSVPQRGMCFLPRRALAVSECEIARAYKVAGTTIEPISFIVPRKAETFQSDIYPPALSSEPALTAAEFFSGKNAPAKLVNLEDQSVFSSSSSSSTSTTIVSPGPTRTSSAPAPEPVKAAVAPSRKASEPVVAPAPTAAPAPSPVPTKSASPPSPVEPKSTSPVLSKTISSATSASDASALQDENTRLNSELREARAQIRNLELQVESLKANAQKAKALLGI